MLIAIGARFFGQSNCKVRTYAKTQRLYTSKSRSARTKYGEKTCPWVQSVIGDVKEGLKRLDTAVRPKTTPRMAIHDRGMEKRRYPIDMVTEHCLMPQFHHRNGHGICQRQRPIVTTKSDCIDVGGRNISSGKTAQPVIHPGIERTMGFGSEQPWIPDRQPTKTGGDIAGTTQFPYESGGTCNGGDVRTADH